MPPPSKSLHAAAIDVRGGDNGAAADLPEKRAWVCAMPPVPMMASRTRADLA